MTGAPLEEIPADATPEEIAEYQRWLEREEKKGQRAFYRQEMRHTKWRRTLDCHCTIDPREPYRYSVWKLNGIPGVFQARVCDFHMRADHRY